jgi:hypothetical protein
MIGIVEYLFLAVPLSAVSSGSPDFMRSGAPVAHDVSVSILSDTGHIEAFFS